MAYDDFKSDENAWEVLQNLHMTRYLGLSSSHIFHLGAISGPSWVHAEPYKNNVELYSSLSGHLGAIWGPF